MLSKIRSVLIPQLKKWGFDRFPSDRDGPIYIYLILFSISLMIASKYISDYTGVGTLLIFILSVLSILMEKIRVNLHRYILSRIYVFSFSLTYIYYFITPKSRDVTFDVFIYFYAKVMIFSFFFIGITLYRTINGKINLSGIPTMALSWKVISKQFIIVIISVVSPVVFSRFLIEAFVNVPDRGSSLAANTAVLIFGNENSSSILYMSSISLFILISSSIFIITIHAYRFFKLEGHVND